MSNRPSVLDYEQRQPYEAPYFERPNSFDRAGQHYERGFTREQPYISPVKERNLILTPSKNANVLSFDFELLEAWKRRYGYF